MRDFISHVKDKIFRREEFVKSERYRLSGVETEPYHHIMIYDRTKKKKINK